VTNLYSSAIFIGVAACLLCIMIEVFWKYGIGLMISSIIGFGTLIIAHHLALAGDTMEMMRAVLDSNFWLATHVVAVTLGYAATFVAGICAVLYIFLGVFTPVLIPEVNKAFSKIAYAIICFAVLFSFVGTVLGGIWADQSWGRFWGWDPKENGALIIVLWNAIVLHARWGGLVRERGLMNMIVFGNIVTAWSWFGVNMLCIRTASPAASPRRSGSSSSRNSSSSASGSCPNPSGSATASCKPAFRRRSRRRELRSTKHTKDTKKGKAEGDPEGPTNHTNHTNLQHSGFV
jgi:ABC-type transport system involved in cytochrome c biogenesis permease subunit